MLRYNGSGTPLECSLHEFVKNTDLHHGLGARLLEGLAWCRQLRLSAHTLPVKLQEQLQTACTISLLAGSKPG